MKTPHPQPFVVPESEFEERFIRASGPGGQNVNKVATAVELRFDVNRSSLPDEVKERLRALGGRRISSDGILVIDSRAFRTQKQNREAARVRLQALIEQARKRPVRRKATKPRAGAREERLASKKRRGAVKALRGPGPRGEE